MLALKGYQQQALEALATAEEADGGEYLRPIALIQAERRSRTQGTVTVEQVRDALLAEFAIPAEQVAIEAYDTHDLAGRDVLAHDCPIRFIVTQQKLREGWDCPFAYVLASVAEQHAATAVEQILGRILRMPSARRKSREELNRGYALVSSVRFQEAATALRDALVEAGFERLEAQDFVVSPQGTLPGDPPLFARSAALAPQFGALRLPGLAIQSGQQLEMLDADHLAVDWTLDVADATLAEAQFPTDSPEVREAEIDVGEQGKVQTELRPFEEALHRQMQLVWVERPWTIAGLVAWLDRRLPDRHDVTQAESIAYLARLIDWLGEERKLDLQRLGRARYRLLRAVSNRIAKLRAAACAQLFNRLLCSHREQLAVSPDVFFELTADLYAPSEEETDRGRYARHAFPVIGRMDTEPERACALYLDQHPEIECWARNLSGRPRESFWFQTATDRFYPDFLARRKDGRYLVVEVKNEPDWSNDDSKEKRLVGDVWAQLSGGRCLFIMPKGPDWRAVDHVIRAR